jgi:hypothetical protein
MKLAAILAVAGITLSGCARNPQGATAPSSLDTATLSAAALDAKPGYEPAYFDGGVVTINAIEVPQNTGPLEHAAADFYQVVYPPPSNLWPSPPQCNPCDHQGNGIDPTDFHDHVLDSIPSNPGGGEFSPLWHVFLIVPKGFFAPGGSSAATLTAYRSLLPMKSETAIDNAIAAGVAEEVDTNFYFLCAVVNAHASH